MSRDLADDVVLTTAFEVEGTHLIIAGNHVVVMATHVPAV